MKIPKNFKRLIGEDWDFAYLLELEQYKFKRMAKYFAKSQLTIGWEKQVETCNLLVKLLDIVLEKDALYNHWLHESYGKINHETGKFDIRKFPRYINIHNAKRFFPSMEDKEYDSPIFESLKAHLRQQKAWYLYNKLRYYRMQELWD